MKKTAYSFLLFLSIPAVFLAGSLYGQRAPVMPATASQPEIVNHLDATHSAHTSHMPGNAQASETPSSPAHVHGGPAFPGGSSASVSPGAVSISPEKQQLLGVRVSPVEKASGTHTVRLLGRVASDETRVYRLNAGIEGFIREVAPVTTGDHVKRDQLLATFSAPNATQIIQAYILVLAATDRAKQGVSERSLEAQTAPLAASNLRQRIDQLQNLGMSALQMEELKRTREVPDNIKIVAPGDGVVLARNVSPDQKFERGAELFRIADLSRVWILADVFENEAQYLRPGQTVTVSLPQQKKTFKATVSTVPPQFDPASRTLKVRLEAENPEDILRPDMFVDVELQITHAPTLAVPSDAVLDSGAKKTVFVEQAEGLFEPRQVETGSRLGDRVEIIQGLRRGERIVTAGTFLLDSESRMKLASTGATGHMHAGHAHHAESLTGPASTPSPATQTHEGHMHPPVTGAASETASLPPAHEHSAHQHAGHQHP